MRKTLITISIIMGLAANTAEAKLIVYNNSNNDMILKYQVCDLENSDIATAKCADFSTVTIKAISGKNYIEIENPLPTPTRGHAVHFFPYNAQELDCRGKIKARGNFGLEGELFPQCSTIVTSLADSNRIESLHAVALDDMKGSPRIFCSLYHGNM